MYKAVVPRFRVGDHALMRHTRLPRYARGKRGIVEQGHGVFVFPDTSAHEQGQKPQHVYSVRITARELWAPQASERDTLRLALWTTTWTSSRERIHPCRSGQSSNVPGALAGQGLRVGGVVAP